MVARRRPVKQPEFGSGGSIHDNDRQEPAIVRLLAVGGSTIAEEAALVGVRIEAKVLEASDPRAPGAIPSTKGVL